MFLDNMEKGYTAGETDLSTGKGKRVIYHSFKRMLSPDTLRPGGDARVIEYMRGYKTAFEDDARVHNVRFSDSHRPSSTNYSKKNDAPSKSGASMSNYSIEDHIENLENLRVKLEGLQEDIITTGDQYQKAVQEAEDNGLIKNYLRDLEEAMGEVHAKLKDLYHHIKDEDITLINSLITKLEGAK